MDLNTQQPQQPVTSQLIQIKESQVQIPQSSLPRILLIALGIIVVLGLVGGAYYFGAKGYTPVVSKESLSEKPTIAVNPTAIAASPSLTQTTNWKIYVNKRYAGITFAYPENWSLQDGNAGQLFVSPDNKMIFSIAGPYFNNDETPENITQRDIKYYQVMQVLSTSPITISNHTGIKQELMLQTNGQGYKDEVGIYLSHVKQIVRQSGSGAQEVLYGTIVFYMNINSKADYKEANRVLDQILSTMILP